VPNDYISKLHADGRTRDIRQYFSENLFHSSPGDMDILLESTAWKDIETQIQLYIQNGYDEMDVAGEQAQFLALQAEIRAAKQILAMPHLIRAEQIQRAKENNNA